MASLIADEKRKEMEAEMNRFEQEILGPSIPGMPTPAGLTMPVKTVQQPTVIPATLPTSVTPTIPISTTPSFIPHQVQVRPHQPHHLPPPPPPPMMHMPPGHHQMMQGQPIGPLMPPMPPPDQRGNMNMMSMSPMGMHMPPRRPMMYQQPSIISKPPTVYSAAPVKFSQKNEMHETPVMTESQSSTFDPIAKFIEERTGMASSSVDSNNSTSTVQGPQIPVAGQGFDFSKDDKGKEGKASRKHKKYIRTAAGMTWEDESLNEWDPSDFRIFCGDLGNEVTDEILTRVFGKYPSFKKAKVVRDKRTNKTKGFGFVSFSDPNDFIAAMREMNGRYVGNRPIKLRKSTWSDRNIDTVRKKQKEKERLGLR